MTIETFDGPGTCRSVRTAVAARKERSARSLLGQEGLPEIPLIPTNRFRAVSASKGARISRRMVRRNSPDRACNACTVAPLIGDANAESAESSPACRAMPGDRLVVEVEAIDAPGRAAEDRPLLVGRCA